MVTHSQTLDTMGKPKGINGYVRLTLDKLPAIRADLVGTDNDWQEWDFWQFIEALRKWTDKNPIPLEDKRKQKKKKRERPYQNI